MQAIISALDWQRQSRDWLRKGGKFVPYPATYLRRGCWMDEQDDMPMLKPAFPECDHQPRCNSKEWCAAIRARDKAKGA